MSAGGGSLILDILILFVCLCVIYLFIYIYSFIYLILWPLYLLIPRGIKMDTLVGHGTSGVSERRGVRVKSGWPGFGSHGDAHPPFCAHLNVMGDHCALAQ